MSSQNKPLLTRRRALLAGASLAIAPLLKATAFATALARQTPIGALWLEAEALKAQMAPASQAIAAAFENGGAPGWMRLTGPINALGHRRYDCLIAILKAEPQNAADLAIVDAAANDHDMRHGPRSWALAQRELAAKRARLAA